MKKLSVLFMAIAAFVVVLAACGKGVIIKKSLLQQHRHPMDKSLKKLEKS